jgi:hypothetical protein
MTGLCLRSRRVNNGSPFGSRCIIPDLLIFEFILFNLFFMRFTTLVYFSDFDVSTKRLPSTVPPPCSRTRHSTDSDSTLSFTRRTQFLTTEEENLSVDLTQLVRGPETNGATPSAVPWGLQMVEASCSAH